MDDRIFQEESEYMKKIAVVADSNSGYTPEEAKAAGVHFIPMRFYIDE